MTFDELNDADLRMIQRALEQQVREQNLLLDHISVTQSAETRLLEATAIVLSDPYLESSGNAAHRRIRVSVTMFTESPETERDVLWGRIWYSVDRDHSNFFPVPKEYGEAVTVQFNWEFDRKTRAHGPAEVRDRDSLHYVSVRPNEQLTGFVNCCADVVEQWAAR
jgi:hypothetical protein